ncbi:unnamed protein product [Callosobruchus maculatus]|uniref:Peptidase C1A papain C-terminal domain-containing protein n=1 Tax=Callosobruchus maculatus TaxID=64391 RepID=A0A653CK48_CALMS|nr:unnamed protein product [Callosobruchus maculatus]
MRLAFITVAAVVSCTFAQPGLNIFSDEYIEFLNSQGLPWKAGRNFAKDTPLSHIQGLLNSLETSSSPPELESMYHEDNGEDLPEEFDARKKWSNCESIREIRDQSACGSCWAFSSSSVMSDRVCIHSGQKNQLRISAADIMECCDSCTDHGDGCFGGTAYLAFKQWVDSGFVSGGGYHSAYGCKPYPFPDCNPHCWVENYDAPKCKNECDKGSQVKYEKDKHYAKEVYMIISKDERQIQLELIKNGPVVAHFTVYDDFQTYQNGVYTPAPGSEPVGRHSVRIIGWGTENDTHPYWLITNSWNKRWGDQGLFKIMRGKNVCGIEDQIIAGLPQ